MIVDDWQFTYVIAAHLVLVRVCLLPCGRPASRRTGKERESLHMAPRQTLPQGARRGSGGRGEPMRAIPSVRPRVAHRKERGDSRFAVANMAAVSWQ